MQNASPEHLKQLLLWNALSKAVNPPQHNTGLGDLPVSYIKKAGHLSRARPKGASSFPKCDCTDPSPGLLSAK